LSDQPLSLPLIICNGSHLRTLTDQALDALRQANSPPTLFQYGGNLARLRTRNNQTENDILGLDGLRGHLARGANCVNKYVRKKGEVTFWPISPPLDVVRDLLSLPTWPTEVFPLLKAIVSCPVFSPEGELIDRPGYHPTHGIYYAPANDLVIPDVSSTPSREDVEEAKRWILSEWLSDFPFADDRNASKAHAVALFLELFTRDMIKGPLPLLVIEADKEGTGKTLLAATILQVTTGAPAATTNLTKSDDETRKAITAAVIEGSLYVLFDNVPEQVDSSVLANALTAPVWSDRVLGESRRIRLPIRWSWVLTGNNVRLSREIARRAVLIRLESNTEKPHERDPSKFKHPDLVPWAQANRGKLIWAALTLIRNWIVQGKKPATKFLGSYESFAQVMGGILEAAGIPGFLENATDFFDRADDTEAEWHLFVAAWVKEFGDAPKQSKHLYSLARKEKLLPSFVTSTDDEREQDKERKRFGHVLKAKLGACYAGYKITDAGKNSRDGTRLYKLLSQPTTVTAQIATLSPELRDWTMLLAVWWYWHEDRLLTADAILVLAAKLRLLSHIIRGLPVTAVQKLQEDRLLSNRLSQESELAQAVIEQMEGELCKMAATSLGVFEISTNVNGHTAYRLTTIPGTPRPPTRHQETQRRKELHLPPITDEDVFYAYSNLAYSPAGSESQARPFSLLSRIGTTPLEDKHLTDMCHVWWQLAETNVLSETELLDIVRAWALLPVFVYTYTQSEAIQQLRNILKLIAECQFPPFRVCDVTESSTARLGEGVAESTYVALEIISGCVAPPRMDIREKHASPLPEF
jgi:hypothetical protein